MADALIDYHNGIYAFDAGYVRPLLAAIHLIESDGRAAFVDTANFEVMPRALAALAERGLGPDAVDYVILTHIHLDHAGGAGVMMEAFPNAKLVVHPRGARHMIEPTKLMAGVEGVYGQERARTPCCGSARANCCASTRPATPVTISPSSTARPAESSPATPSAFPTANWMSTAAR
jgi:hypothetical protein